jgi:hypothetical protein
LSGGLLKMLGELADDADLLYRAIRISMKPKLSSFVFSAVLESPEPNRSGKKPGVLFLVN